MSWTKKVLRVNLTNGSVTEEPLNMEWAHDYLGQRGLATRIETLQTGLALLDQYVNNIETAQIGGTH